MLPFPPPRLSEEEYKKRWRPGITLQEVDPEFWAWKKAQDRRMTFTVVVMILGLLIFVATMIVAASARFKALP